MICAANQLLVVSYQLLVLKLSTIYYSLATKAPEGGV